MDRLRQLLNHIAAQMGVLTVSQRVAIGLCAALIAGSLLWLLQWSTTPNLVPLVNSDFSFEDLDAAETALRENAIAFHTVGGRRILVHSSDRDNALRLVYSTGALPQGTLFDMAAAVADQNPFLSPEQRTFAQNFARGNELARIIATTPSVRKASVIINPESKRRLGLPSDVPTASVDVTMARGKELTSAMVDGLAKLVSGAVAGLKPYNVTVRDSRSGRSFNIPRPEDALSFDLLNKTKEHESYLRSKIESQLVYIPGVHISVSVELDASRRKTKTNKYDKPQPKSESGKSTESNTASQPTEPGVQANLGTAVTAGPRGQSNTTEDTTTENFPPQLSETEIVEKMPLAPKHVTATVSIPRSFIAGLVAAKTPEKKDAKDSDPEFVALRDEQVARVRASVEKIIQSKKPEDVQVDIYPDMMWSAQSESWTLASGGELGRRESADSLDVMGTVRSYGPPVGLGMLALMSLLMMTRIVRKSADLTREVAPAAASGLEPEGNEPFLAVGSSTVGKAAASESMLTGREVDESTLRYQELGEEVTRMVSEDPRSAAELVRRWVEDADI